MKIGPYSILRQIARGGMGEVLLVFDPGCERSIALKRIRENLKGKGNIRRRFLKEAKLTASLTHPGVISIYNIHDDGDEIYYTMPYVEGKTLKQLLRKDISIASLLSLFKSLCQTISYAHSRGILHRDIKPENVLVGNFGEVIILDWGLAQVIGQKEEPLLETTEGPSDLTIPGKIVGTLAFMAPERALGAPASIQSEVYALGVILYLILTLKLPFERLSLKEFRENWNLERIIEPEENAPYRDISPRLSRIVMRALSKDPLERFKTVDELLIELSKHLEGKEEWLESSTLSISNRSDWEFQENLMLSKHLAMAQGGDWLSVSISKNGFGDPLRISTHVTLDAKSQGIGFSLNIPEPSSRESPFDGFCLWLSSQKNVASALFRNGIEVMPIADLFLKPDAPHHIVLEKSEKSLRVTLDGVVRFTYLSYLPITGNHIAVVARDADFDLKELHVYSGSTALSISCLAVADAFLANRDYKRALQEYRRIASAFPGQLEGREALFRSGIALLEEAKALKQKKAAKASFSTALEEFSKLHTTPAAPLEYLGKSLVYRSLDDRQEEIKCLELALRRYQKHPLIGAIKEQIIYRMHESASFDRLATYQLILIALRYLPEVFESAEALYLFHHLLNHAERPYFIEKRSDRSVTDKKTQILLSIELAYASALPNVLSELFDELIVEPEGDRAAFEALLRALYDLGNFSLANQLLIRLKERVVEYDPDRRELFREMIALLEPLAMTEKPSDLKGGVKEFLAHKTKEKGIALRTALFLIQRSILLEEPKLVEAISSPLLQMKLSREEEEVLDGWRLWALIQSKNTAAASKLFERYSEEDLLDENSLLFFTYACFLYLTENDDIYEVFFSGISDARFPKTPSLFAHEHLHKLSTQSNWIKTAFFFEKRMLYRELLLLAQCQNRDDLVSKFRFLEQKQNLH